MSFNTFGYTDIQILSMHNEFYVRALRAAVASHARGETYDQAFDHCMEAICDADQGDPNDDSETIGLIAREAIDEALSDVEKTAGEYAKAAVKYAKMIVDLESFIAYFDVETLQGMERALVNACDNETDPVAREHVVALQRAVAHMIEEKS